MNDNKQEPLTATTDYLKADGILFRHSYNAVGCGFSPEIREIAIAAMLEFSEQQIEELKSQRSKCSLCGCPDCSGSSVIG